MGEVSEVWGLKHEKMNENPGFSLDLWRNDDDIYIEKRRDLL